ncbi:hypothetical protein D9M73_234300 [compost metagenome]
MPQRDEDGDSADDAIRKVISEVGAQLIGALPHVCRQRRGKQSWDQLHPGIGMGVPMRCRQPTFLIYMNAAVLYGPELSSVDNRRRASGLVQRSRDTVYFLARRHHLNGIFHIPVARLFYCNICVLAFCPNDADKRD